MVVSLTRFLTIHFRTAEDLVSVQRWPVREGYPDSGHTPLLLAETENSIKGKATGCSRKLLNLYAARPRDGALGAGGAEGSRQVQRKLCTFAKLLHSRALEDGERITIAIINNAPVVLHFL
ncbi:hypothetical protein EVAR_31630_1 [Eumeta japonica]|uniref:Uncharacterized protein n=1 Tax=Eumeta variegata TaxID=151549 RepID=A0A4C1VY35_EUMVA|nr:hypothetical protein EVAR_31630_1 [Eumeta japonica]